jgi:hypothetical protein
MKTKQQKPLSMRFAAHTTLHINNDFVTNGHFALRASVFHVLNLKKIQPGTTVQAYGVNGAGRIGNASSSYLDAAKIQRVFDLAAENPNYADTVLSSVVEKEKTVFVMDVYGHGVHIAKGYAPLLLALYNLPGTWQIEAHAPLKMIRYVLNGETVALLMPVKI